MAVVTDATGLERLVSPGQTAPVCGKTAQLMAIERHDAVERRSQFCTDDDRLAEHLGRILDAAHQIEIEPVGGADIAVWTAPTCSAMTMSSRGSPPIAG